MTQQISNCVEYYTRVRNPCVLHANHHVLLNTVRSKMIFQKQNEIKKNSDWVHCNTVLYMCIAVQVHRTKKSKYAYVTRVWNT